MILYKYMKPILHSPDGDTDFFNNIVAGVLQRNTLAPYLFTLCLPYVPLTLADLIKNGFTLKKRQEADDILQKLWQMQTMQMI